MKKLWIAVAVAAIVTNADGGVTQRVEYPNVSSYCFALGSHAVFFDPDGNGVWTKAGKAIGKVKWLIIAKNAILC